MIESDVIIFKQFKDTYSPCKHPTASEEMVDRSATVELATLKSVSAFRELLTRCGKYLP
jgi:hypothetical protein